MWAWCQTLVLPKFGNDVLYLDVYLAKIKILECGGIPIYEPGQQRTVKRNGAAGRLHDTTDMEKTAHFGTVQFIAVGTPPGRRWLGRHEVCDSRGAQHRLVHDRLQGGGG